MLNKTLKLYSSFAVLIIALACYIKYSCYAFTNNELPQLLEWAPLLFQERAFLIFMMKYFYLLIEKPSSCTFTL